jgi:D-glycero-alpha-D-manno-heptose 1-phosphate guanylyltransferase
MEAIILAGGIGSRLRSIIKDVPKPMALVDGKPFLEMILDNLNHTGFTKVILSVGYLSDVIVNYFGDNYKKIKIEYAVENERLGTGGAIKYALQFCSDEYAFVFNGDTFLNIDVNAVIDLKSIEHLPVIVSRHVDDVSRYGALAISGNKLTGYREKLDLGPGVINAGCYYLPTNIMNSFTNLKVFSFEKYAIPEIIQNPGFVVYKHDGLFIDIGIPEDLFLASTALKNHSSN